MSNRLDDHKIVITGATRGIGRAMAELFTEAGARVLGCGQRLASVEELERETGIAAICCDVSEAEDVRALAETALTRLGGVDVLVNCAGIQRELDVLREVDMDEVERELAVNLLGPMRVTHALLEPLLESGGSIVNVTSILALTPKARAPVYCASKAGLASWTTALREQLRSRGVHVMELVPPLVATDMTRGRANGAIEPRRVAEACLAGLVARRDVVRVEKARLAFALHRVAPGALARRLRDA